MSTKLQDGFRLLNKAGHDRDLLASALLAFHGALEDFFREQLSVKIDAYNSQQNIRRSSWHELIQLWETHRGLTNDEKETIRAYNKKRNLAAHGSVISITRAEVEHYGQFVQSFIRRHQFNIGQPETMWQAILAGVLGTYLDSPNRKKAKASPGSCLKIIGVALLIPLLLVFCIVLSFFSLLDALLTPFASDREDVGTPTQSFVLQETEFAEDNSETSPLLFPPTPIWVTPIGINTTISVQVIPADVYLGPGTEFEIIHSITSIEVFKVLEVSENARWYKIQLISGQQGWIKAFQAFHVSP